MPDDLDALADLHGRADVTRYLPFGARTQDEAARALADKVAQTALAQEGDVLNLVVEERGGGAFAGEVYLFWRSGLHGQVELGWVLNPRCHGRGYATEAAGAMLALAFDQLGAHRVFARIDPRNGPSRRVAQRLGMRHEGTLLQTGHFQGEWVDEELHALLAREWRERPAVP